MLELSIEQMSEIEGGGFWEGFGCGVTVFAAILEPTFVGEMFAVAACGYLIQ